MGRARVWLLCSVSLLPVSYTVYCPLTCALCRPMLGQDINSSYQRLPSTDDEDPETEPHESEDPDDISSHVSIISTFSQYSRRVII